MSIHFERGLALGEVRRWDLSEIEFRRVLAETPDDALAHANLSVCLCNIKGRLNEALSEADEAVRLEPDDAFCHVRRGWTLCLLRRCRDAEAEAREAIRLDPTGIDGFQLLAEMMNQLDFQLEALDAADKGLAISPVDAFCLNLRAIALMQLGRISEFHQTADYSLSLNPETAFTHAALGWRCFELGDHRKAREYFLEALRLEPDFEWARTGLTYVRSPLLRAYDYFKACVKAIFLLRRV